MLFSIDPLNGKIDWKLEDASIGPVKFLDNNLYVSETAEGGLYNLKLDSDEPELEPDSESVHWTYPDGVSSIVSYESKEDSMIVNSMVSINKNTGEKIWSSGTVPGRLFKTSGGIFVGGYQSRITGDISYATMYNHSSGKQKWKTDFYEIYDPIEYRDQLYMNDQNRIFGFDIDSGEKEWSYYPQKLTGIKEFSIIGNYLIAIEENLVVGFDLDI